MSEPESREQVTLDVLARKYAELLADHETLRKAHEALLSATNEAVRLIAIAREGFYR